MSTVAIIDYGAGNIRSIQFALERLGTTGLVTSNASEIAASNHVIFPGVGAAGKAMEKLQASKLDLLIPKLTQPVLGICLGMQLLCRSSEENTTKGLDIFSEDVTRFSTDVKIPHMGWNTITELRSPLFEDVREEAYVYMVHSYYVPKNSQTIAITDYGLAYAAAIQKDNFFGVQFHPEKSGEAGAQVLQNFLAL
ncbi:MAG: imidazole glycerol phosphate synthase subunit HisH [Flavobacteriaceae bacterium]|nr:imidazole glycerol phosphate synthase subunit HisH [Flavobacteriaceae bacterium]|tara:strand:+ start:13624 stop:14208 length:585 start_codon:yes stop_codon:yes gene_type:complete